MFTRNALHHLPDFWKAIALDRIATFLRPGGVLRLHDLIFDFQPAAAEGMTPGDLLRVEVVGDGRVMVTREDDPVRALAEVGRQNKIHYPPGYLVRLRAEWD